MDKQYFDDIVRRADEHPSRRNVLLSVVGGTAVYFARRALPRRLFPSGTAAPAAGLRPAGLCPTDPATEASLAAAKAALAAGKTTVNLSPKGCLTYSVATSGTTTTDTIKASGSAVMVVTRQGNQLDQKLDADLDGYFEFDRAVKKTSTATTSTQTQYNPASKAAIARETISVQGSTTTVTISELVGNSLQPVDMFTAQGPDIDARADSADPGVSAGGCSAAQLSQLQSAFATAINTGLTCMRHYHATEILLDVMFSYVARDLVFGCVPGCPGGAKCVGSTPSGSIVDPANPVEIHLPPIFFSGTLTDYDREAILWHEFLHSALGYRHDPADLASSRRFERDRVYACETLCFNRNSTPGTPARPNAVVPFA